jgi:ADP-ribose pyrophosphatase YjhB (NUDIX family)
VRGKQALLRVWGRLPRPVRRRLVRLGTASHTVGSIGVLEHEGAVLLVRLAYRDHWGLPGGLLKRGEHAVAAMIREVHEEVGLVVEPVGVPTVVVEPKVRRVDVVFRCRAVDGVDPASAAPSSPEILETRWWPLDALPRLQHEAATALRAARQLG